jgi:hypothetical protein
VCRSVTAHGVCLLRSARETAMTAPVPPPPPRVWYRLALLVALGGLFAAQKYVEVRKEVRLPGGVEFANSGNAKVALGVGVTVLLLLLLVEFAVVALPRLFRRPPVFPPAHRDWPRFVFFLFAAPLLFADLQSRLLSGYLPSVGSSPPLWVASAWTAGWLAFAVASLWLPPGRGVATVGFTAAVVVTRLFAYWHLPFADIGGDMLSTIDRSQDLMLAGRFPYIDDPRPIMPYWPGTFLLYTPAKLLGVDFRLMNLLVEVGTVVAVGGLGGGDREDRWRTAVERMALPLLMLLPNWTYYSAETQYPVSVLMAVLVARAVWAGGGRTQAVALGLAVAVSQTFGALAVFLFPHWVRRFGWRGAAKLTGLSVLACLPLVGPFLVWDAGEFFRVSLLSLEPFPPELLLGRFTLRPAVDLLHPQAAAALLGLVVLGAVLLNARRRATPTAVAVTLALGYCLVLLLLHRTFTHYFLPVVAMVVSVPYSRQK